MTVRRNRASTVQQARRFCVLSVKTGVARAAEVLKTARREIYRILAEDDAGNES